MFPGRMNRLLPLILAALTGCAVLTLLAPPFEVPVRHLLPVDSFPQKIGPWKEVSEQLVDQEVQKRLPTARITDRIYENVKSGQQVSVMLLSATAVDDIHKPTSCLPAQGWRLDQPEKTTIAGQNVTILTADQEGRRIKVGYWLTGYYPPRRSYGAVLDRLLVWRNHLVGEDKAKSLFVRVIAADTASEVNEGVTDTTLTGFIQDALPAVRKLTASAEITLPSTTATASRATPALPPASGGDHTIRSF